FTILPALGRKMFAMNAAPAGSLAPMRRDPRVLPIELDALRRDAREQLLADESPRRRVAGLLDECAAVSMNRRFTPPDGLPRRNCCRPGRMSSDPLEPVTYRDRIDNPKRAKPIAERVDFSTPGRRWRKPQTAPFREGGRGGRAKKKAMRLELSSPS